MNPVPLKPLVEVIPGQHTTQETLNVAISLLRQMNKDAVVIKDSPGFISNRVLMLTINEAIALAHEQVASPRDIDDVFKRCFGHKMGPLETADLIGLDTVLRSLEVLSSSLDDAKYRPCPLLKTMVDAGKLGRKTGEGFFSYPAADGAPIRPRQNSLGAAPE
jgi:3-hydroxybutyryl-CoA dehydrogenase